MTPNLTVRRSTRTDEMKPQYVLAQVLTTLAFFIIGADFAAIHGSMAYRLGIPLSGVAQYSPLFVPVAALLPHFLPRRIPAWIRFLGCYLLVLAAITFPIIVFSLGSRGVAFSGDFLQTIGLTQQLQDELGFSVVIFGDSGGTHIYFPRAHDPALVRDALRRHQLQPND
jgi:hypothetical protein